MRHGEAENNTRSILSSFPETTTYPLTELGKKEVSKTAQFLAAIGADALVSSPMQRTKETAEIISRATGLPIQFDDRLREADFGIFNERYKEELFEKYPTSESRISAGKDDGVESFIDIRGRLTSFLDDMKEKYGGKKVILVSHGDPLEQLHGIFMNEAPGWSAMGWYPEKGSCTEVVWRM